MKSLSIVGILLVVLGITAFVYQGFTYTTQEKIVDLGSLQVTAEKSRTIPLPPVMGGIALAGGIALLVIAKRRT